MGHRKGVVERIYVFQCVNSSVPIGVVSIVYDKDSHSHVSSLFWTDTTEYFDTIRFPHGINDISVRDVPHIPIVLIR